MNAYFDQNHGFGKYKNDAIQILRHTIDILNEFDIKYMLISGTLLGYVRHNDFIPWDDDIDILVDSTIRDKINLINDKYKNEVHILEIENHLIKFCKNDGIVINNEKWPFCDLFIYDIDEKTINFFGKKWPLEYFFPLKKVIFNSINTCIPYDAHYFLKINYGKSYLNYYKSPCYTHKDDKIINSVVTVHKNLL
jgi:hypothetical protein